MGLSSHKFIETDFTGKKIADLSDTPSSDGMTSAQLKEYFDYIPKAMIALGAINDIIDDLCATSGAEDIGASVPGVTGTNIQAVLESLKGLVDDRYTKSAVDTLLTGKASTSTVSGMIASVDFDEETGTFTFTEQGGTTHTFDTGLEKVVTNWDYDKETQKLVLTLESGETKSVDLSAFVTINEFLDSDTIKFSVAGEKVKAAIKEGSITDAMLQQSLLTLLQGYAASCKQNAESAETSKTNAGEYSNAAASSATSAGEKATVASQKATAAENSQILAQSYAKGGTGTREGEDADNAKYYAEQARAAAGGDFITKVPNPTAGNIPTLTSVGQLQDSEKSIDDIAKPFVVTLTYSEDGTIIADKTSAEIFAAYQAGKRMQALCYGSVGVPTYIDENVIAFEINNGRTSMWFQCEKGTNGNDVWRMKNYERLPLPENVEPQKVMRVNVDSSAWYASPLCLVVAVNWNGNTEITSDVGFADIVSEYDNETPIRFVLTSPSTAKTLVGSLSRIELSETPHAVFTACDDTTNKTYIFTCTYNGEGVADTWTMETVDMNAELAKKGNAALITATNTTVATTAWADDTTYTDFPFRAGITITGCTANHKPDVTFSLTDAVSGNYAPIAESYEGGIYIYAAEKPTAALTIPTITLLKEVGA